MRWNMITSPTCCCSHHGLAWWLLLVIIIGWNVSVSTAQVSIRPTSLQVFKGESAVFHCDRPIEDIGLSSQRWLWFDDTDEVNPFAIGNGNLSFVDGIEFMVYNGGYSSRMTLLSTTLNDDQTQYYCQYGSVSETVTLTVIDGIRLDPMYPTCAWDTLEGKSTTTIELTCIATGGDPRPSLHWYKDAIKLPNTMDFMSHDTDIYSDIIDYTLTTEDERVSFTCKAEGLAVDLGLGGNRTCSVSPTIPPIAIIVAESTVFDVGDSLRFHCSGESLWVITDYMWFVDNQLVSSLEAAYDIINHGTTLITTDLQRKDSGTTIRCNVSTASGLVGTDSISLSMEGEHLVTTIVLAAGGTILVLVLICICVCLIVRRKRKGNEGSSDKPKTVFITVNRVYSKYTKRDNVHGVPLDNPNIIVESNTDWEINDQIDERLSASENDVSPHLYDTPFNHDVRLIHEYMNAEVMADSQSFDSFDSNDPDGSDTNKEECADYNSRGIPDLDNLYINHDIKEVRPDVSKCNPVADESHTNWGADFDEL